jgi:hypothetical protein
MAGLDPAIPLRDALCSPKRDHRDKPGDDKEKVGPYWNLMDFTPEGRPDRDTPPQKFVSEFLAKNYGDN